MKKLIIFLIVLIPISWVLYFGMQIIVSKSLGNEIDLIEKGIIAFMFSLFLPISIYISGIYYIFPRLKYLEGNDTVKPPFKITCSSIIDIPEGFDFYRLKAEISNNWVITFSDDIDHVLKFRTKWHFSKNWGAAAWMKYDNNIGELHLECFPMGAMLDDLALKIQKEIENILSRT